MTKIFLSPVLLLLMISSAKAQNNSPVATKSFYAEVGGPGQLFSANFDSRFKPGSRFGAGFKIGVGYTVIEEETRQTIQVPGGQPYINYNYRTRSIATLPLAVNYLFGKANNANMFEVGAGITLLSKKAEILVYEYEGKKGNVMGHASFMYRRQPVDGGFTWRIGFTPIVGTSGDILPLGAIGLGYSF